jgi:H+/Cl- antiporter ClcA
MSTGKHKPTGLVTILVFICGLYASFVVSGVYEEKLYKGKYADGLRFVHPPLALFVISLISLFISQSVLSVL